MAFYPTEALPLLKVSPSMVPPSISRSLSTWSWQLYLVCSLIELIRGGIFLLIGQPVYNIAGVFLMLFKNKNPGNLRSDSIKQESSPSLQAG